MELVKIARYISDPRDKGEDRRGKAIAKGALTYSRDELQSLSDICPRGVSLEKSTGDHTKVIQKSIITNGRFVTPSGVRNGELEIVDGKIASISKSIKVQKK